MTHTVTYTKINEGTYTGKYVCSCGWESQGAEYKDDLEHDLIVRHHRILGGETFGYDASELAYIKKDLEKTIAQLQSMNSLDV
jgi:hypothetical protein